MSLFSAIQVSASGMSAQRTRAEMLVENMVNAETTRTPEGGPYRRKDAVFETAARTILQCQKRQPFIRANFVDLNEIMVLEPRDGLCLRLKSSQLDFTCVTARENDL